MPPADARRLVLALVVAVAIPVVLLDVETRLRVASHLDVDPADARALVRAMVRAANESLVDREARDAFDRVMAAPQ